MTTSEAKDSLLIETSPYEPPLRTMVSPLVTFASAAISSVAFETL